MAGKKLINLIIPWVAIITSILSLVISIGSYGIQKRSLILQYVPSISISGFSDGSGYQITNMKGINTIITYQQSILVIKDQYKMYKPNDSQIWLSANDKINIMYPPEIKKELESLLSEGRMLLKCQAKNIVDSSITTYTREFRYDIGKKEWITAISTMDEWNKHMKELEWMKK